MLTPAHVVEFKLHFKTPQAFCMLLPAMPHILIFQLCLNTPFLHETIPAFSHTKPKRIRNTASSPSALSILYKMWTQKSHLNLHLCVWACDMKLSAQLLCSFQEDTVARPAQQQHAHGRTVERTEMTDLEQSSAKARDHIVGPPCLDMIVHDRLEARGSASRHACAQSQPPLLCILARSPTSRVLTCLRSAGCHRQCPELGKVGLQCGSWSDFSCANFDSVMPGMKVGGCQHCRTMKPNEVCVWLTPLELGCGMVTCPQASPEHVRK